MSGDKPTKNLSGLFGSGDKGGASLFDFEVDDRGNGAEPPDANTRLSDPTPPSDQAKEDFKWAAIEIAWKTFPDYHQVKWNGEVFANLAGRLYHPHAIARMNPRGLGMAAGSQSEESDQADTVPRSVAPRYVEYAIRNGTLDPDYASRHYPGNKIYILDDIKVITSDDDLIVRSVIKD